MVDSTRDAPTGEAHWRERAEQLQRALESRIVIEQAKGILSERLGLGLDRAFALLRQTARANQVKLHVLSRTVVAAAETPQPIVETLALHPDAYRPVSRVERAVQTEELFRRLNDETAKMLNGGAASFLCECGNPFCTESIELSADALRALHARDGFYAIKVGHELLEVESVVLRHNGYMIVKRQGPGAVDGAGAVENGNRP